MAEIDDGADFVIGSRHVAGGSIPSTWGWHRKLNSRMGNLVARYVAGIYRVRDCTAGFRAIRASVLRRIDFSRLRVQGYAFQVALLHAAILRDATVKEIPVEFVDRTVGESKLGLRDIIEFIINAWWIRFQGAKTFIKFGIVGASGVIVNLGTFTMLLSIVWNFFLNNYWTFRWRITRDDVHIKGLKFNVVSILSLGVSYTTFVLVSLLLPQLSPHVARFVGIVPGTIVNYFLNSYWTFRAVKARRLCSADDPGTAQAYLEKCSARVLSLWNEQAYSSPSACATAVALSPELSEQVVAKL